MRIGSKNLILNGTMLKFEKDDALKTYQHHLSYSKKKLNYQPVKIGEVIMLQMMLMLAKEQMIELINLQTNFKLNSVIEFL